MRGIWMVDTLQSNIGASEMRERTATYLDRIEI